MTKQQILYAIPEPVLWMMHIPAMIVCFLWAAWKSRNYQA